MYSISVHNTKNINKLSGKIGYMRYKSSLINVNNNLINYITIDNIHIDIDMITLFTFLS